LVALLFAHPVQGLKISFLFLDDVKRRYNELFFSRINSVLLQFSNIWIFRCKVRHDSATKHATDSGAKYASIPLERLPVIPLQSTPLC
jgi:hypothetical protein